VTRRPNSARYSSRSSAATALASRTALSDAGSASTRASSSAIALSARVGALVAGEAGIGQRCRVDVAEPAVRYVQLGLPPTFPTDKLLQPEPLVDGLERSPSKFETVAHARRHHPPDEIADLTRDRLLEVGRIQLPRARPWGSPLCHVPQCCRPRHLRLLECPPCSNARPTSSSTR
jgi:hypothetical protein